MNLSVTQRPDGGATVLTAPIKGGSLLGFSVDTAMDIVTASSTKVPIDGIFTQVSVSYLQGLPVSTAIAGDTIFVHQLDPAFEYAHLTAKLLGTHVAEPALYTTSSNIVMPVAGDDGLWFHRFHDSLEPIDSLHMMQTEPATSFAVAQAGASLVSAWSTESTCYVNVNRTYELGTTGIISSPCADPRLAFNQRTGEGVMLFDSEEGVRLMSLYETQMGGHPRVIRPETSSPRTVFDGTNFWVAYLDSRGDIVAGFLDANHQPITIALGAPSPERQSFELTMVDGAPWVFSLDATGYNAYKLCVETK
jgi:hypothetical protein